MRFDSERVDIGLQKIAEYVVHHAMTLQPVRVAESFRNDGYVEVATAVPGSFVPGMKMTLILDH